MRDAVGGTLLALFVLTWLCGVVVFIEHSTRQNDQMVLVGVGCEGQSRVAVAYEEDRLPRCESIEIHVIRG